jgi:hypothetical protein
MRKGIERTPIERELGGSRLARRRVGPTYRSNFGGLITLRGGTILRLGPKALHHD